MTQAATLGELGQEKASKVPSIAIIGLEGAGKTVLVTTLAKRLSFIDSRGIFLNPQGVKTLKYVESIWETLQSGEWPASTPMGEMFQLHWKFQIVGELEFDLRLIDVAGQDLRVLFGDEQFASIDSLPRHLQDLAAYCRSADIVLFLVNLRDHVGQGNAEQRVANEAAIKSAMDYLTAEARHRRICLVLTQTDMYRELAKRKGGWLELVANAMPYVFGAHIKIHETAVIPVSAVADTKVVVGSDGKARRVPARDFHSEGFEEMVSWLTLHVREIKELRDSLRLVQPAQPLAEVVLKGKPNEWLSGSWIERLSGLQWWILAITLILAALKACADYGSHT